METMDINDLKANPKNPRQMSRHDADSLARSMKEFGDLSSVVFNVRTQQLVGGHQRIATLKRLEGQKQVQITQRFDAPTDDGTVGLGYIIFNKKPFPYREVDWPIERELAANIAANRVQGEFDIDLLAEINFELSKLDNGQELLELSGQQEDELKRLNKMIGADDEDEQETSQDEDDALLSFALTREQREIVEEALGHIKATREMAAEKNSSLNGNALYYMSRDYLDRLHGLVDESHNG